MSSAARWLRSPRRPSARARLTATFTGLLVVVGASMVTSVFLVMSYVPRYDIVTVRPDAVGPAVVGDAAGAEATAAADAAPDAVGAAGPADSLSIAISTETDLLRVLLTTSLVVFVVVLAGGVWLSWVVAGRVLRPLDHLTRAARAVELGQTQRGSALDDRRIALAGPNDEFRRLASTFDDMLGRLDASYEAQSRFAANASHELRTPLATTQALLDVALADPEAVDTVVLARRLRETNTRSMGTVESLLTLADAASAPRCHEPVDVAELVRERVPELVRERVPDRSGPGPRFDLRLDDLVVTGDRALLHTLVSNLLDNAVRHNRPAGRVSVTTLAGELVVVNDGAVLRSDEVARLTEPFHRHAGRVAGSHGLGLSIVAAVCRRHGASLDLAAVPGGGLRVQVRFADPAP